MLYGQQSAMPVYYKRLPGSIPDVSTLASLLETMNFLEYKKLHLVLDKGFYSEDNLNDLFDGAHKFTIGASTHLKWIQRIIDGYHGQVGLPEHYRDVGDEALFVQTKLVRWGAKRKRLYVHLFYNSYRAAATHDAFMRKLLACKQELEAGRRSKANETFYSRYFTISETPVRGLSVKYNNEAILAFRDNYAGFFVLLSNQFKDPVTTLYTYRNKDVVENCFDDLNQLDMKRLRMHSSASMDGRLFLQFLALIYISALSNRMKKSPELAGITVRELLESMESYAKVSYAGRYGHIFTELTKKQRVLLKELNITPDS
jgi:transposase